MIKSPLNYTGGKYKLLPQMLPFFPKNINTFVDLFCGGCNVGINVNATKIVFNDNLTYLINLYNEFKKIGYDNILLHINKQINDYNLSDTNEIGYNELRKNYNNNKNILDLFVLICYSFNHQIRFNNKHEFNTSFGKERSSFNEKIKNNLQKFVTKISSANISFSNYDFINFDISKLDTNDFVYLDPPYLITTGSYNDGKRGFKGWTEKEELELYDFMKKLNEKNIKFALSNVIQHKGNTNEFLIKFIDENSFNVNYLDYSYSNCNYHTLDRNPKSSIEILITNYKIIDEKLVNV
jgi:DNA adenine methylase